jgi:magnesium transporter
MTTASHRRYLQPISSLSRHSETDDIAESSSTPSSIIAWAWYVDGVRKPAENLSVAAHLANAGERFVYAQDLGVGGDRCSADDGGRHLRDEL